jgi:hypothetical protein
MLWFAPEMVAQGPGWEVTPDAISFGQVVSVPMFGIGMISWMAPTWVLISQEARYVNGCLYKWSVYCCAVIHISTGASTFDPLGMIPTIILLLIFWKCRALRTIIEYKKAELIQH